MVRAAGQYVRLSRCTLCVFSILFSQVSQVAVKRENADYFAICIKFLIIFRSQVYAIGSFAYHQIRRGVQSYRWPRR